MSLNAILVIVGGLLILVGIDRLFGTWHMPGREWPPHTGIENGRVPAEFSRQFIWPFRRRTH